jgi:hypothetical protein
MIAEVKVPKAEGEEGEDDDDDDDDDDGLGEDDDDDDDDDDSDEDQFVPEDEDIGADADTLVQLSEAVRLSPPAHRTPGLPTISRACARPGGRVLVLRLQGR